MPPASNPVDATSAPKPTNVSRRILVFIRFVLFRGSFAEKSLTFGVIALVTSIAQSQVAGRGVGRGRGVGADRGVGVGLGVAVAVGVGVAVAVAVTVALAVGVGVGEKVAVAVGLAVAVGVGVGVEPICTSKDPLSIRALRTRQKSGPR